MIRRSVVVLTTLLAACGGPARRGAPAQVAEIVFTNESIDQAAVYIVAQSGLRTRVGTVSSGRTDTLRVSPTAIGGGGTVTIYANILARSRSPNTGPVSLAVGERVHVTLPTDQRLLTVLPPREP